jgi:hypothetical protein
MCSVGCLTPAAHQDRGIDRVWQRSFRLLSAQRNQTQKTAVL